MEIFINSQPGIAYSVACGFPGILHIHASNSQIWTPADSLAHDQDWAEGLTCCLGSHCDIKGCAANNAAVAAAVATQGQVTVVWSCETQTRTTSAQICATNGSTADQQNTN